VRSRGNTGDRKAAIVPGDSAESSAIDHHVDAGERLPGRAVDYLSGDCPGWLLRAEWIKGGCGTQNGAGEQGEKTVG
jgi:hypothetical protein